MDNQKFCRFRNLESHLRNSIKMLLMVFIIPNSINPSRPSQVGQPKLVTPIGTAQVEKVYLNIRRHTYSWKIVELNISILGW